MLIGESGVHMNYGVIDIGSNTIRLVAYRCTSDGAGRYRLEKLFSGKETAGLAGYVENRALNKRGIEKAVAVLKGFGNALKNLGIRESFAFATASLRNVANTQEAVAQINRETGFAVDVLSGEEEAQLDFAGASYGMPMDKGVMLDIGGGSTEIVLFRERRAMEAVSLPFGSLSLFRRYVFGLLPTGEEYREICHRVQESLEVSGLLPFPETGEVICGIGGTIRACARLMEDSMADGAFPMGQIEQLLEELSHSEKKALDSILRAAPERVHTVIPGAAVLRTAAEYFGCKTVWVSEWGVREGYLLEKVLGAAPLS